MLSNSIFQVADCQYISSHQCKRSEEKILKELQKYKDWTNDFVVPPDVYKSFNCEQNCHTAKTRHQ